MFDQGVQVPYGIPDTASITGDVLTNTTLSGFRERFGGHGLSARGLVGVRPKRVRGPWTAGQREAPTVSVPPLGGSLQRPSTWARPTHQPGAQARTVHG